MGRLRPSQWWLLLFLIPGAGILLTPVFFRDHPQLAGVPFFWWYQLIWVPISAAVIVLVAALRPRGMEEAAEEEDAEPPPPEWWLNWEREP
jgi:peptidoglycan/LPS O-acetylase OafA/YrhL